MNMETEIGLYDYKFSYTKEMKGAGLHQEVVYSFDFLVNKDNIITKKWKKNNCYLALGDTI